MTIASSSSSSSSRRGSYSRTSSHTCTHGLRHKAPPELLHWVVCVCLPPVKNTFCIVSRMLLYNKLHTRVYIPVYQYLVLVYIIPCQSYWSLSCDHARNKVFPMNQFENNGNIINCPPSVRHLYAIVDSSRLLVYYARHIYIFLLLRLFVVRHGCAA